MRVQRDGTTRAINANPATFTGTVTMDRMFSSEAPGRVMGASVTFQPGARTFWHTHPFGQTLIVTDGTGWTQCEGGPIVEIRVGDIITCPCEHRHWHGATATTPMTHIAITEGIDGAYANWMEEVPDDVYLAGETQAER